MRAIVLAIVAVAFGSVGCGTIFTGTTDMIAITSNVRGAEVRVDGFPRGVTPTQVELDKDKGHIIEVTAPGHEVGQAALTKNFNGIAVINLLCLPCWAVDAIAGGMWTLNPDAVYVNLKPVQAAPVAQTVFMAPAGYQIAAPPQQVFVQPTAVQQAPAVVQPAFTVPATVVPTAAPRQ